MEEYVKIVNKNTELFSLFDAETLWTALLEFVESQGIKHEMAKDKYKMKLQILIPEGDRIDMTVKVLKVDHEKVCLEFSRTGGDQLIFFSEFSKIKEYYGDLINATY